MKNYSIFFVETLIFTKLTFVGLVCCKDHRQITFYLEILSQAFSELNPLLTRRHAQNQTHSLTITQFIALSHFRCKKVFSKTCQSGLSSSGDFFLFSLEVRCISWNWPPPLPIWESEFSHAAWINCRITVSYQSNYQET